MSKEWTTFLPMPIRLGGTRKTTYRLDINDVPSNRRHIKEGNCLDTVKGCPGGKTNEGHGCWWGCYSKYAMKRAKKIFDEPITQTLIPEILAQDLQKSNQSWVRIGLHGDPCLDWDLTVKTVKVINDHEMLTVILTRFWELPTKKQLKQLARLNVHLHGTLSALDKDSFIEPRFTILKEFQKYGGISRVRLVTFAFKKDSEHWKKQDYLANQKTIEVLEQPANVRTSNPIWDKFDEKRYSKHHSYDTGCFSGWYSAGPLYELNHCDNPCWKCKHKCMTFC